MRRNLTPIERAALAHMAFALRSHVTRPDCYPTRAALEVIYGAATVFMYFSDPLVEVLAECIEHRMERFGMKCGDVQRATREAAVAWECVVGRRAA